MNSALFTLGKQKITSDTILQAIKKAGIKTGDNLFIHSNLVGFGKLTTTPNQLLSKLLSTFTTAIGEEGTIIMPTFSYSFCQHKTFNVAKTKSTVGVWTEFFRRQPGVLRSHHPIFSFAAKGPKAAYFTDSTDTTCFGPQSAFARLISGNTKHVFFGTDVSACTFIHLIEETCKVPYRFHKRFSGKIIADNYTYQQSYQYYVRYLDRNVDTSTVKFQQHLTKSGALKRIKLGGSSLSIIDTAALFRIGCTLLKRHPNFFLKDKPTSGETPMLNLIKALWLKRRDIISTGFDESLKYISKNIPLKIHSIPSGTKCWTWIVPEQWEVKQAYIEDLRGHRLLDLADHPLHVVSYSLPINREVSQKELLAHLHTLPNQPNSIPFEFKYYERDWGFCIQHNRLKNFKSKKYHVVIDSRFKPGALKVGEYTIQGQTPDTIVLAAHLCHPGMANDDLTGVAVLIELAKQLGKQKPHYTYTFLLFPETIGSIAFLSQNSHRLTHFKNGIFLEMLGNNNQMVLQFTRDGNTYLDRIATYVLKRRHQLFSKRNFIETPRNDEMVFNGPGVNIPMISLNRFPYPEYHTSDDSPAIISEKRLEEAKGITAEIIHILDSDFIPQRTFTGPIFLSRFGLWVDWRINKQLNKNLERVMLHLEGDESVFDIAETLDMDFDDLANYLERLQAKKLIIKKTLKFKEKLPETKPLPR